MPVYEFRCESCGRRVNFRFSFAEYETARPVCPHCQSQNLTRLISRVTVARSEESRLDSLDDLAGFDDLDDADPETMGRMLRKMSQEVGEPMPEEFDEVVNRLESGESPESIEKSMPDLADAAGDSLPPVD